MPRRVSLVVLREDALHESFAAAFLNASSLPKRGDPRYVPGVNRAGVVSRFANEARGLLRQGAETHLIVMVDADGWTYADVREQLLRTLDDDLRARFEASGRWMLIAPNWEMEHWVHCIEGREVTEERDLKLSFRWDKECRPAARRLAELCAKGQPLPNALPSLEAACVEWRRYLDRNDL